MKAIVTTTTDHTNVYAYLSVQPINDDGTAADGSVLPAKILEMCREQFASSRHLPASYLNEAAGFLQRLGWDVRDDDGKPYVA